MNFFYNRIVNSVICICLSYIDFLTKNNSITFSNKDPHHICDMVIQEIKLAPLILRLALTLYILPFNFKLLTKIYWRQEPTNSSFTLWLYTVFLKIAAPTFTYIFTICSLAISTNKDSYEII